MFISYFDSCLMEVHPRELPMVLGSHLASQGFGILQPKGRTGKVPWPCTVTRSCAIGSSRPESNLCFCLVLRPNFTKPFAFILVIILADLLALEVSFPTKKESRQSKFIWSLKSVLNSSLSRFGSNLPGLDF